MKAPVLEGMQTSSDPAVNNWAREEQQTALVHFVRHNG